MKNQQKKLKKSKNPSKIFSKFEFLLICCVRIIFVKSKRFFMQDFAWQEFSHAAL